MESDVPPSLTVADLLKEISIIAEKYAQALEKEGANVELDEEETAKAAARLIQQILVATKESKEVKEIMLRSQWGSKGCTASEKRVSEILGDDKWCKEQLKVFKSKMGKNNKFVAVMWKVKGDKRFRQANVIKFKPK